MAPPKTAPGCAYLNSHNVLVAAWNQSTTAFKRCGLLVLFFFIKSFTQNQIHIFPISVWPAVSGFVPLSAANIDYTGWLKDRILKPARKLSLVVTFVTSNRARPDQIADLVKELYIPIYIYFYLVGAYMSFNCKERKIWPMFQLAWPAGWRISTRTVTQPARRPDRPVDPTGAGRPERFPSLL